MDADDVRVKILIIEKTISNVLQSDTVTADSDVMQATGEEMQSESDIPTDVYPPIYVRG